MRHKQVDPDADYPVSETENFDARESRRVLSHPVVAAQIHVRETVSAWRMATISLFIFVLFGAIGTIFVMKQYTDSVANQQRSYSVAACERAKTNAKLINQLAIQVGSSIRLAIVPDCNDAYRD